MLLSGSVAVLELFLSTGMTAKRTSTLIGFLFTRALIGALHSKFDRILTVIVQNCYLQRFSIDKSPL